MVETFFFCPQHRSIRVLFGFHGLRALTCRPDDLKCLRYPPLKQATCYPLRGRRAMGGRAAQAPSCSTAGPWLLSGGGRARAATRQRQQGAVPRSSACTPSAGASRTAWRCSGRCPRARMLGTSRRACAVDTLCWVRSSHP